MNASKKSTDAIAMRYHFKGTALQNTYFKKMPSIQEVK